MKNIRRTENYDDSLYMTDDGWQVKPCGKNAGRLTIWNVLEAFGLAAGGYAFIVLALVIGNAIF